MKDLNLGKKAKNTLKTICKIKDKKLQLKQLKLLDKIITNANKTFGKYLTSIKKGKKK